MQPTPELSPERRLALVVATSAYADASLRRLRAPAHDAAGLSDVLSAPRIGGFTVTQVIDRTAQDVRLAFEEFLAHRDPHDLVVVYVSCHGLVDARRRLYFAATDTRKDRLAATGVEAQWLLDQLDDCRARRQVVILDCCFSGAFAQRTKGDTELGLGERFHGHARGRVVLTASRATEYSFEGQPVPGEVLPGSVFTSALVAGIRSGAADIDHDGYISVDDAYSYAFDRLREDDVPQTPQRWLFGAEGKIVLARAPAVSGLTEAGQVPGDLGTPAPETDFIQQPVTATAVVDGAREDIAQEATAPKTSAPERTYPAVAPSGVVSGLALPPPVVITPSPPASAPHRAPRQRLPLPRTRRGHIVLGTSIVLIAAAATTTPVLLNAINDPGSHGRYDHPRGSILVDAKPVTGSKNTGQKQRWKRTYTDGPLYAHVTGYASQAFGTSLLENIEDKLLTGTDSRLGSSAAGNVYTTIDVAAQKAAYDGLKGRQGAVVALDPLTGKILALVSAPSYSPSVFAGAAKEDTAAWTSLKSDKRKPMLNRALSQTLPPGSPFKVITAAAALENGLYNNVDKATDSPAPWMLPQTAVPLKNTNDAVCKNAALQSALLNSCHTVFAKISNDLGNTKMRAQAAKFGFNKEITVPALAAASVYPADDGSLNALDGIGQGSTSVTPLQMAMVASAVANEGNLMRPYLVASLRTADGRVIDGHKPATLNRPLSELNARKLQQMMQYAVEDVEDGPGSMARIPGSTVGGTSGLSQRGSIDTTPYAWFVSYAMTEDAGTPAVAVAVVVEAADGTGDGSADKIAAPIAKSVMEAVLRH